MEPIGVRYKTHLFVPRFIGSKGSLGEHWQLAVVLAIGRIDRAPVWSSSAPSSLVRPGDLALEFRSGVGLELLAGDEDKPQCGTKQQVLTHSALKVTRRAIIVIVTEP